MERRDGACPVHGQEQEAGSGLADVMHVQVRRHGRGRGQVESKILLSQHRAWTTKFKQIIIKACHFTHTCTLYWFIKRLALQKIKILQIKKINWYYVHTVKCFLTSTGSMLHKCLEYKNIPIFFFFFNSVNSSTHPFLKRCTKNINPFKLKQKMVIYKNMFMIEYMYLHILLTFFNCYNLLLMFRIFVRWCWKYRKNNLSIY